MILVWRRAPLSCPGDHLLDVGAECSRMLCSRLCAVEQKPTFFFVMASLGRVAQYGNAVKRIGLPKGVKLWQLQTCRHPKRNPKKKKKKIVIKTFFLFFLKYSFFSSLFASKVVFLKKQAFWYLQGVYSR